MIRKWVYGFAIAAVGFTVSGCAAALLGSAAGGGYHSGSGQRTSSRIAEDSAVTKAVKSKLIASRETKMLYVNVATYEGVVSLRGEVPAAAQRVAAERVARSVKGVRGVKNELRVK